LTKKKKKPWGIAVSFLSNATMHYQSGNSSVALTYLDILEHVILRLRLRDNLYQVHYQYFQIFNNDNNFSKALDHFIIAQAYRDSVHSENSKNQIRFLNAKFQSEKKDKEILKSQLTIKRQNLLIISFMLGAAIICGFMIWLFLLYRRLKQFNQKLREKNNLIENQKSEILLKSNEM